MKSMPVLSLIFGILLCALAAGFFFATGGTHYTALIPSSIGLLLIVCGCIGLAAPNLRMHAMHAAALLGVLGAAGGLGMSLPKIAAILTVVFGEHAAVWEQLAMGLLSLVFLVFCVKSFIAARRARKN